MLLAIILITFIRHVNTSKLIQVADKDVEISGSGFGLNEEAASKLAMDVEVRTDDKKHNVVKAEEFSFDEGNVENKLEQSSTVNMERRDSVEELSHTKIVPAADIKYLGKDIKSEFVMEISYEFWINLAIHLIGFLMLMIAILLLACRRIGIRLNTGALTVHYPDVEVKNIIILN